MCIPRYIMKTDASDRNMQIHDSRQVGFDESRGIWTLSFIWATHTYPAGITRSQSNLFASWSCLPLRKIYISRTKSKRKLLVRACASTTVKEEPRNWLPDCNNETSCSFALKLDIQKPAVGPRVSRRGSCLCRHEMKCPHGVLSLPRGLGQNNCYSVLTISSH